MRLKEIKVGQTYAYIHNYPEYTRKSYCYNLPDAHPVKILDIKKVPVDGGMDACGRPNNRRMSVLVYEIYDIPASHMLAKDLDIIKDKHPDLVSVEEAAVEPQELIWEWDKEVDKVRQDHKVKIYIDRFMDFIAGVNYRSLNWMLQRYNFNVLAPWPTAKMLVTEVSIQNVFLNDSHFKVYLYDLLTGHQEGQDEEKYPAPARYGYGRHGRHGGQHRPRTVDEMFPFIPRDPDMSPKIHVLQSDISKGGFRPSRAVFEVFSHYTLPLSEAFYRRFGMLTKVREIFSDTFKERLGEEAAKGRGSIEYGMLWDKAQNSLTQEGWEKYRKLSPKQRLAVITSAVELYVEDILKTFPDGSLPIFSFEQNWSDWKAKAYNELVSQLPARTTNKKEDN